MAENHRRLAAIMFTDVVGYSAMTQRDEAQALRQLEAHRALLRPLFAKHQGREIKTIGDAFLVEFSSAVQAVRCAVAVQDALRQHNAAKDGPPIRVRVGIHLGDVEVRDGDLFGDGVNIASRLEPLASPGGICLSGAVVEQVRGKVEVDFASLGRPPLKNIESPVEVFAVKLPWQRGFGLRWRQDAWLGGRGARAGALTGLLALAVLAAWWWARPGGPATAQAPAPANADGTISLAVLPFSNLSDDPANEYFSDGMTEELLNALAQVKGLRVPARTSAFAFKGKNESIRKIGQELNVGKVVEGSVRKDGNKVRITAQLINVADGFHLWSQTYDRELADIFELQEELARAIAEALKLQLLDPQTADLVKPPTDSVAAYNLYLQGRFHWNKRNEEGFEKAIDYFEQALEADPQFALAHVGIADAYSLLASYGYQLPQEAAGPARQAAERALAINDTLAEAHTALAMVEEEFEQDFDAAERGFKLAIELNPSYATAHHWYATLLVDMGRNEEALEKIETALALDPLSPIINMAAASLYQLMGQHEAALTHTEKALEIDPDFQNGLELLAALRLLNGDAAGAEALIRQVVEQHPNDQRAYVAYGQFLHSASRFEAAVEEYDKALSLAPNGLGALFGTAFVRELQGRWDEAAAVYERMLALAPEAVGPWGLYGIHLYARGQTEAALEHLNRAHQISPNDNNLVGALAMVLQWSGQPEAALAEAQRAVAELPECVCTHAVHGLVLVHQGRLAEAEAALARGRETVSPGDPGWQPFLDFLEGLIHAAAGRPEDAARRVEALEAANAFFPNNREMYLAWLHVALDDDERGLDWLERAYEARGRNFNIRWIGVQPELAHLRDHPRFVALLEKLGLN